VIYLCPYSHNPFLTQEKTTVQKESSPVLARGEEEGSNGMFPEMCGRHISDGSGTYEGQDQFSFMQISGHDQDAYCMLLRSVQTPLINAGKLTIIYNVS
jgi:hypothetical protein